MTDDTQRYSVLLVGFDAIPGGATEAARRLEQRFKLAPDLAKRLVEAAPAVVKKDIRAADAQKYIAALKGIGAEGRVVPYHSGAPAEAATAGIMKRPSRRTSSESAAAPRVEEVQATADYPVADGAAPAAAPPFPSTESPAPDGDDPFDDAFFKDDWRVEEDASQAASGAFDPASFALPTALSGAVPAVRESGAADAVRPAASAQAPSPALAVGAYGGDGADAGDADSDGFRAPAATLAAGPARVGARPTLLDELMAITDDDGPSLPGGSIVAPVTEARGSSGAPPRVPLSPTLRPTSGATRAAFDEPSSTAAAPPTAAEPGPRGLPPDSDSGVGFSHDPLSIFGHTARQGASADVDGPLELDTENPRLTGRHAAVPATPAEAVPVIPAGARPATARLKQTVMFSGDPMTAEIDRTLADRPTETIRREAVPVVTGGFSAVSERSKVTTRRVVRWVVRLCVAAVVVVAAVAGWFGWEDYRAELPARRFAQAPDYFEFQARLGGDGAPVSGVRSCARGDDTLRCRYSREVLSAWFPDLDAPTIMRATASCFSTASDDGRRAEELLDCLVKRPDGTESRLFMEQRQVCDNSLRELTDGGSAGCDYTEVAALLAPGAPPPPTPAAVRRRVEFRRDTTLPSSDVGELTVREYAVTSDALPEELVYESLSFGLVVRRARLAGATTLRITHVDMGGQTRGTAVWPR